MQRLSSGALSSVMPSWVMSDERVDFQLVVHLVHRQENGLQVVVAVGAFAYYVEAEVNLAVWVGCHKL